MILDELEDAPSHVRAFFAEIRRHAEATDIAQEAIHLQRAYLAARIVGEQSRADALHVAVATVSRCRVIVSWNFRHVVNFQKIPLYNGVNLANGYGVIGIHTPQEVVVHDHENEDV